MGKGKIKIQVLDFKDARSVLPNTMGFFSSLFLALHLFKLPTRASESPERTQELLFYVQETQVFILLLDSLHF